MTTEALVTISLAWLIIAGFTGYFFLKVLNTPQEKNDSQ